MATLTGLLALGLATPGPTASDLEAPVRLKAGDTYIDTGEHIAHSGPLFADVEQRGVRDLLVGTFKGHILVYRNEPVEGRPNLKEAGLLEAEGEPIRVHNW